MPDIIKKIKDVKERARQLREDFNTAVTSALIIADRLKNKSVPDDELPQAPAETSKEPAQPPVEEAPPAPPPRVLTMAEQMAENEAALKAAMEHLQGRLGDDDSASAEAQEAARVQMREAIDGFRKFTEDMVNANATPKKETPATPAADKPARPKRTGTTGGRDTPTI